MFNNVFNFAFNKGIKTNLKPWVRLLCNQVLGFGESRKRKEFQCLIKHRNPSFYLSAAKVRFFFQMHQIFV